MVIDWIFSSTRESNLFQVKDTTPCKSNPKFTFLSKIILSLFCNLIMKIETKKNTR